MPSTMLGSKIQPFLIKALGAFLARGPYFEGFSNVARQRSGLEANFPCEAEDFVEKHT